MVRGLKYRHIAGYLRVVGQTKHGAERNTKTVSTRLIELLPDGTTVQPGRYKGIEEQLHVFEVPVILNRPRVREILATFALQGGPEKLSA